MFANKANSNTGTIHILRKLPALNICIKWVREVPLDSVSNDGKHTVDASGSLTPFAPDAHYVRLEQAIEYYMLNIALREIVQVRGDKTVFKNTASVKFSK